MTLKELAAEVQERVTALNEALASVQLAGARVTFDYDDRHVGDGPKTAWQIGVGCYQDLCPPPPRRKQEELGI